MITREQIYALLALRKRKDSPFFVKSDGALHTHIIENISNMHEGPGSEFNTALRHAASGTTEDIRILAEMVRVNPRLLLQAGNIVTRGGVSIIRTTLYEFFLGEGDPHGAKSIEFGFANIPNGENEQRRQYERYRPSIEAMANQIKSKQPEYDLRPLFEIIKKSTPADITAALMKDMNHESPLRDAMCAFRNAVRPKKQKKPGMHYKHYTTLMQAMDLLYDGWEELSNHYTNNDKCDLVCGEIFKYLQISLPAVDRFGFARAFGDNERTTKYQYCNGTFPDAVPGNDELPGVAAIFGRGSGVEVRGGGLGGGLRGCRGSFGKHMSSKNFMLAELMPQQHPTGRVTC